MRAMNQAGKWIAVFLLVIGLSACGDDPAPSGGNTDTNQGSDSDGGGYN